MLESRTFGHMSSIFQGHSETTRLLFTTCLPRVASQPGGTPYRGAGGFFQVGFGEIPPGKMGRLMFSEILYFLCLCYSIFIFSQFYPPGNKNSKIVWN